ncbi:MAG: Peptidoglycan-binding LysM [Microgenomates group bacterium GW2011_GWA2_47_8]|nr:MAG: Peptidoglycan-binding LysM [Microgenomates group bacterium GW2011_GWA2_47_8]
MKIIVVIFILLAVAGYYVLQNGVPENIPTEILSTKISSDLAVENVKKLPEVQQYLKDVPNGKVEVDNELEGEYNVHVYEVKNGHTATFNWYRVSIKSGEIRPEFEINSTNTGTILGKLCYPSEILPPGKIEAKRLSDNQIFTQDYPGNQNGDKSNYAFELEEGDYYLRYKTKGSFGYSTTVCPTGNEETCADTKKRVPVMAVVKDGMELKNYDLCDYFYKDSNAPKF